MNNGRAALRRKAKPAKPKPPPLPAVVDLTPADVFDDAGRQRVPRDERAAHAARWVHRQGREVRTSDAVKSTGLAHDSSAGRAAIDFATSRGWLRAVRRGVLVAGDVPPAA